MVVMLDRVYVNEMVVCRLKYNMPLLILKDDVVDIVLLIPIVWHCVCLVSMTYSYC